MISTDRKILEEGSAVRARVIEYAGLFEKMDIILFSKRNLQFSTSNFQKGTGIKVSDHLFVYPTCSFSRLLYIFDAIRIGSSLIKNWKLEIGNSRNDLVVSCQDPFETGKVGAALKNKFGIPLQVQVHTDFLSPEFPRGSFLNWLRVKMAGYALRHADSIRVVSQRIKDSLLHELRIMNYELRIDILPIFVDVEKIQTAPISIDLHKKYPQFDFIILMASRLTKEKDIPTALAAFQKVLVRYPRAGFVIVGSGPELSPLQLIAKRYTLNASVIFEGWHSDLASYYKTCDLFLQTSRYEGYGMSLVEALAAGAPAVSTDVGVAPEVLSVGEKSFVCPVSDAVCLAEKICEVVEHPDLRAAVAAAARSRLSSVTSQSKAEYLEQYKKSLEVCRAV